MTKISRDAKHFVNTGFQGMAGNEIKCLSCKNLSKNQQIFVSLSIPIPYQHQGKSKVVSSLKKIKTSIQNKKNATKMMEKKKKKNNKNKNNFGSASVRAARPRVVSSIHVTNGGEDAVPSSADNTNHNSAGHDGSTAKTTSCSSYHTKTTHHVHKTFFRQPIFRCDIAVVVNVPLKNRFQTKVGMFLSFFQFLLHVEF